VAGKETVQRHNMRRTHKAPPGWKKKVVLEELRDMTIHGDLVKLVNDKYVVLITQPLLPRSILD
jgi:hypothetical protein